MKQVYIASPFRGDYAKDIRAAVEYCRMAGECGVLPLTPHLIFSQWCDDTIPEQREQGKKLGFALLERSNELWVMGRTVSEGMQEEIVFAKEHSIPTFYIPHPIEKESYLVSGDGNPLLSLADCIDGSRGENYEGEVVILRHENLTQEYRTPRNQIWVATHGPGCRPDWKYSATVHLRHPVDGDSMAVERACVWGKAKPETLDRLEGMYPEFSKWRETQGKDGIFDCYRGLQSQGERKSQNGRDSPYHHPNQTTLEEGDEEFSR